MIGPADDGLDARVTAAMEMPPEPTFWVHLTEIMHQAAEIERLSAREYPGLTARSSGQFLLHNLADLLSEQAYFQRHQEKLIPLMKLSSAAWDLNYGRTAPILAAAAQNENPGQSANHAQIKGMAARAMSELMEAKVPREVAARRVSSALREANKRGLTAGTRSRDITWKTVAGWRDELNKGPHEGESIAFRMAYTGELPPSFGTTPLERGQALLEELRGIATLML